MANILIISGHADPKTSTANKVILETVLAKLPQAKLHELATLYPDGNVDVKAEQDALLAADVVVFDFPVYWYAMPAVLKNYVEKVFTHGFAYGTGAKLGGKQFVASMTTGAPASLYKEGEGAGHTLESFLFPLQSTVEMCGLVYKKPVISYGMLYIPGVSSEADRARVVAAAREHGNRLAAEIASL